MLERHCHTLVKCCLSICHQLQIQSVLMFNRDCLFLIDRKRATNLLSNGVSLSMVSDVSSFRVHRFFVVLADYYSDTVPVDNNNL